MRKKNYAISIIRLLAFCMIVSCHIFQYYGNELAWWLNCGVQIFLLISGYLYGQRDSIKARDFYKRNLPKILVDYYLYLIIILPIYSFAIHYRFLPTDYIRLALGLGTNIPGLGHLWYISTIVICYFITPFAFKLLVPDIKVKYIALLFLVVEGLCIVLPGLTGAWINCYVIGLIIGKKYKEIHSKETVFFSRLISLSVPFMILLNGLELYIKYIKCYEIYGMWGRIANTVFHYGHITLAIFIFSGLMILVPAKTKKKERIKLLDFSDKYSYDAYIVHLFFVLGPASIFAQRAESMPVVSKVAVLIPIIVLCAIILKSLSDVMRKHIFYHRSKSAYWPQ